MTHANHSHNKMRLLFCGGVAFAVLVAAPVFTRHALAQEVVMRSTLDPQSPLAKSPVKKLKKTPSGKNRFISTAPSPLDTYKTETLSDAEPEAEALQQLYGDETADGVEPKKKTANLSQLDAETGDLAPVGPKTTSGKKLVTKNGKLVTDPKGREPVQPGLDEQTTGTLVVRKGQTAQMLRAQKAIPKEQVESRSLTEDEDLFQATGIRFGSVTLRPSIEQGVETTSNSTASAGGATATNSVTTFRMDGISDWQNSLFETNGFVTLRKALSGDSEIDPEAGASFKLTQPIFRDWNYTISAAYGLKRETAISGSAFPATIIKRPLAQDIRLSLEAGKREGLLQPSFKVELDRLTYGDATDGLGATLSQADRDQTTLRGTIRLGAEISPALTPFVELAYGKTWRDEAVDMFGNDRSSTELRASIGTELNISEKLSGEFSVGWLRQSFGSSGLTDIDGIALAAALSWSPQQGTVVTAGFTTNAEPANSATISGSLVYGANLGITHQLSSRWSASANLSAAYRDFTAGGGDDTTLGAELAATYWVNRMLGVNAKARYETVSSSDPLRESDTTTLLLGLKIQR